MNHVWIIERLTMGGWIPAPAYCFSTRKAAREYKRDGFLANSPWRMRIRQYRIIS